MIRRATARLAALAAWIAIAMAGGRAEAQGLLDRAQGKRGGAKEENAKATMVADVAAIEAGKPFRLGVKFTIRPGWHIYYREPGKTGLPTEIKWKLPEGFKASELVWPKPKTFDSDPELLSYGYTDETLLFARVDPPAGLAPGAKIALAADATWLVCKEDGQCVPGEGAVALELAAGQAASSPEAALFDAYEAKAEKPAAAAVPAAAAGTQAAPAGGKAFKLDKLKPAEFAWPAWVYFLLAIAGGIILNVMPCVLPVLSIKILGFVRQSRDDPRRVMRMGLFFTLGVFVSFAALATIVVAARVAGRQLGWGFQLQEPRFVIAMSALLLAFGLSLFGVFSFEFPGSALQGAEGLGSQEGPAGAFFNGFLATALATPCTAPLLGWAVGFAFAHSPAVIYLFFFAIAAGFALPYALLAAKPGWLKFLPKPGDWMETFKQAMGFPLLATDVWLLSVLGSQAGPEAVTWTLAFLTSVALACWLLGRGFDLRASAAKRTRTAIAAAAIVVVGYLAFPERHLRSAEGQTAAPAEAAGRVVGKIQWKPFSPKALEDLAAQNKTVFVDFTAEWCWTCKVNEKAVLAADEVQQAFLDGKIETLVADYTKKSEEITKILRQFGRAGVPMYVVFPAGRPEEPILLPEALTPSIVKDALAKAAAPKA